MTEVEKFMSTIEADGTKRVMKKYLSFLETGEHGKTPEDIQKIVLEMKPKSQREIINIFCVIQRYAEYLGNDELIKSIRAVDKAKLWEAAKPNAEEKFISYEAFEATCQKMQTIDLNPDYIRTLFKSIYEGIYNDDMSVLKNLKASDLNGNVATLHSDDGECYQLQISDELANELRDLAAKDKWIRKNRYGLYPVEIRGVAPDSCFKVEFRSSNPANPYKFTYYRLMRKVSQELGYKLLPFQLFASGIMHRIGLELQKKQMRIEDAFADNNRDRTVGSIIAKELERCNYNTEVRNFRQLVKGHLDVFSYKLEEDTRNDSNEFCMEDTYLKMEEEQDVLSYKGIVCDVDIKDVVYLLKPQKKKEKVLVNGHYIHARNRNTAMKALVLAEHKCEVSADHQTFCKKSDGKQYTEPHHLIPLAYSDAFDFSLDVEENIVSLCSHCHNCIHYGKNAEEMVVKLYQKRKEMLSSVGLEIALSDLLKMYDM